MRFLTRSSLRTLILGGGAIIAVGALIATFAVLRISESMLTSLQEETEATLVERGLADQIRSGVDGQVLEVWRYLASPDTATLERFRRRGNEVYGDIREYLFRDLSVEERAQVERIRQLHEAVEVAAYPAFELARRGQSMAAWQRASQVWDQAAALGPAVDLFLAMGIADHAELKTSLAKRFRTMQLAIPVFALLVLGALAGMLGFVHRRLLEPLAQLDSATQRLGEGDLATRLEVGTDDEIGRVTRSFNQTSGNLRRMRDTLEHKNTELTDTLEQLCQTQTQLVQSQKLEAVGRLAGGVAHDFNNILTVIVGECEMAIADTPADHPLAAPLHEIFNAGERASTLTRQLLAFSRRQLVEPTVFSLNDLLDEAEKMLRRLIEENIELTTHLASDLGNIEADRGQIEQVLVNLVVNARDAMPDGGVLTIRTAREIVDEEGSLTHDNLAPGEYVTLTVSDTGTGIADEVKDHLFEPFYTTKPQGKGTGLGLATCYGIVEQISGHIAVYSEVGLGTTFRVYLAPSERAESAPTPAGEQIEQGSETVLLVEDELSVRNVTARILRRRGHTVLEADSGEEALRLLEESGGEVHLLLTDVVLPGIGGRELAERVRETHPGIRAMFCSGYTDDVILQSRLLEHDVTLLQKPFTAQALMAKVREVLGESGPPGEEPSSESGEGLDAPVAQDA